MTQGVVRRGRRQAGVSLVELMIALGIIAIALMAIISSLVHTMRSKEYQRELTHAKQAATSKLEEIRAKAANSGAFSSASADYLPTLYANGSTFNVEGLALPSNTAGGKKALGTIVLRQTLGDDRLLDFEVQVKWLGVSAKEETFTARGMITK